MSKAQSLIQHLGLQPHPEGGYYKETYRADITVKLDCGKRNVSTSIYYLLEGADKSHLHRVAHDEIWYFHQGAPLEIIIIQNGRLIVEILGNELSAGQKPQIIVPANHWFGARLQKRSGYALVSCSVSPGFDFNDFELATWDSIDIELITEFTDMIR